MVVTDLPAKVFIVVMQARAAFPSTWTVHAPHWAMPQPYLVPVRSMTSRRYQRSGISGSPSNWRVLPLTLSWIISDLLERAIVQVITVRQCRGGAGWCVPDRHWPVPADYLSLRRSLAVSAR